MLRAGYPFELEWEEGGALEHVRRVVAGEPLYAEPALEFIAFPYPPLFFWLAAVATRLAGEGFLALRLVSIASSVVCLAAIYRIAARRAGERFAGWIAAAVFAASYRACGAWLDVARVDSLSLALTLAAVSVLDARGGALNGAPRAAVGAGLFFLSFFAKQSALVPAAACAVGLSLRSRRDAAVFATTLAALVAASTVALDRASSGWYRWYVFEMVAGHPWDPSSLTTFWRDMALGLAPAAVLVALAAWRCAPRPSAQHVERAFVPCAVAGLWIAAWLGRAHVGGYDNTLMPAFAGAALLVGPALAVLLAAGGALSRVAAGLFIAQVVVLAYGPRAQLPSRADREAGEAVVARLRATEGEVWMPDHGYLARLAGKGGSAHGMAVIDLLQSGDRAVAQRFVDRLAQALREGRYAAIVLDERWDEILPVLGERYERVEWRYAEERTFLPVTGDPRRPRHWYLRRAE